MAEKHEKDEQLVDLIRNYPCLYDTTSADFKVALTKEHAWKTIATTLERTSEDVQQRWKQLRDRCVRELKKKKNPPTASAVKTWELLEHMMFLREFVKHRKTVGNIDLPEDTQTLERAESPILSNTFIEEQQSSQLEDTVATLPVVPNKRHCNESGQKPEQPVAQPVEEVDVETLQQLKGLDEESLYAQSVAGTLRQMSPQKRAMAKMKIQQILYEIQYCTASPGN